ncbi:unnamed protein product [Sphagnum balticum]
MGEGSSQSLVQKLIEGVNSITSIGEFKNYKKECAAVTRRVKLLLSLFEEVRDSKLPLPDAAFNCFKALEVALYAAKDLLILCHKGSKLYLTLERPKVLNHFQALAVEIVKALDGAPYNDLDVSDEVREQVELVHNQFKRLKGLEEAHDAQLHVELTTVLNETTERLISRAELEKLAEKFELTTAKAIKQETQALEWMKIERDPLIDEILDNEKGFEQMHTLLRNMKTLCPADNLEVDIPDLKKIQASEAAFLDKLRAHHSSEPSVSGGTDKGGSPNIPDDFKCPISLDLMKDPVIVATGQTYERAFIQKWLDAGNRTCPKTGLILAHTNLTPNYVLRSVIAEWCETQGIEVPKKSSGRPKSSNSTDICCSEDRANIEDLISKLASGQTEVQRNAAGEVRLLAKRNIEHRIYIAEAGAIPLLVKLLWSPDPKTQEHAVTALLNLSINDNNKGQIVSAGAIHPIVEVLRTGSREARENAAATLFSLSVVDENKVTIGNCGAIPALVDLLRDGTPRGKKDAATALFNLSIYQGNKSRAVRAGIVPPLIELLGDSNAGMVDEALAILAILATHLEGRIAIGQANATPMLIEIITSGSPRNKENGAAVLLALCTFDPNHIVLAKLLDAFGPLSELVQDGTTRAKRKAAQLLELMRRQEAEKAEQSIIEDQPPGFSTDAGGRSALCI